MIFYFFVCKKYVFLFKFKHLKVHGFLSLGDVELDLDNQGHVLVKGFNENPKDNASSNGSGKSSLHNAIAWVLTGETVNGLKTNISNIYLNDGCFGTLSFYIDKDNYEITRYKDYGKNLLNHHMSLFFQLFHLKE